MRTFQNTVTIALPADEVFAFLADLRNIPAWNYAIERTLPTSPGPAGVGATYRQTRTIPRPGEEDLQIIVFQPPSRLAIQGQIGPFQATTSYLLEPAAGGTRLTNTVASNARGQKPSTTMPPKPGAAGRTHRPRRRPGQACALTREVRR